MPELHLSVLDAVIVEEDLAFSFTELCRASGSEPETLQMLVHEGCCSRRAGKRGSWWFSGASLQRARAAMRLGQDLQLGPEGTALVLDLLAQIAELQARLRRAGLD